MRLHYLANKLQNNEVKAGDGVVEWWRGGGVEGGE